MKSLILIRGLPGAGKTSFAKTVANKSPIIAADDFFEVNGKYKFDADLLHEAHTHCLRRTEIAMMAGEKNIYVTNTFTTEREMKPYFEIANTFGYTVFSIIVENRLQTKNIHNVSEETINKMKNRFNIKL